MNGSSIGFITGLVAYVVICAAACGYLAKLSRLGTGMVIVCSLIGVVTQIFGVLFVLIIWAVAHSRRSKFQPQTRTSNVSAPPAAAREPWRPTPRSSLFCPSCGKQILATDRFCGSCGVASSATANASSRTENSQLSTRATVTTQQNGDTIQCPKCGGTQITAAQKGFSGTKAVAGMLFVPGGILWGLHGKNKVIVSCLRCGHQWTPKR